MRGIRVFASILFLLAVLCTIFAITVYQPMPERGAMIAPAQIQLPCYISYGSTLDDLFKEPFENGVFIFKDGRVFVFTNNLPNAVVYPEFVAIFKKFNLKIEDCIMQVHNHLIPSNFSLADKKFATYLRALGFKGIFALYIQPTKEVKFL